MTDDVEYDSSGVTDEDGNDDEEFGEHDTTAAPSAVPSWLLSHW